MPNLGPGELLVIMAIALIVFGPKKLPEIGKGMGNALREFNKARNDFMDSLHSEADSVSSSFRYDDAPSTTATTGSASSSSYDAPRPGSLEQPAPLEVTREDALPYGGDFHVAAGDSQPSIRSSGTAG